MAQYLNLAGVEALWAKIKGTFALKSHTHSYLPLSGGTMNLGEGLKFHSDDNYFGENSDARIISLIDRNGTVCDGGLIIDERCIFNGTEHITELLRIRDNEFKWKETSISLDGHTHTKSQITDFPTSLPASDVYSWAKAATKPSYKTCEVKEETNLYFTNQRAINACSGTYLTKHISTATNVDPLIISRNGSTSESLRIGVDDTTCYFFYENDELANNFRFTLKNTDTESGNKNGNESYVIFSGNSSGSHITANYFSATQFNGSLVGNVTGNCSGSSGSCTGNAATATSASCSRNLLGRNTSGSDYGATAGNLVFAEWNTHGDNRWYLKAEGYETRVGYANSAGSIAWDNITGKPDKPTYTASEVGAPSTISLSGGLQYQEIARVDCGSNKNMLIAIRGTNGGRGALVYVTGYGSGTYVRMNHRIIYSASTYKFYYNGTSEGGAFYVYNNNTQGGDSFSVTELTGGIPSITKVSSLPSDVLEVRDTVALTSHTHTSFANSITVTGSVSASSGFYQSSDERLKIFHDPIKVDLDKLKTLRKNYFKFNNNDELEIGVSAQEVQEIYPELVTSDEEGYLSVAYDKLSVIALAAIDKLDDDVKELKELKQENNELKNRLNNLESILKEKGIL